MITIHVDTAPLLREIKATAFALREQERLALNVTIAAARDEAARRLAAQFGVTPTVAEKYVRTEPASLTNPTARLVVRDLFIQARKLSPVQTATGVAVTVPGVFATELRHAFIATMRSGSVGVFRRTTRPAERRGPKRSYLPIQQQVVQVPSFLPAGLEEWTRTKFLSALELAFARLGAASRKAA